MDKDRLGIEVDVSISGKKEELIYRVSSCSGVKLCPLNWYQLVWLCGTNTSSKTIISTTVVSLLRVMTRNPVQSSLPICILKTFQITDNGFAFVIKVSTILFITCMHPIHGSSKMCSKVKQMIADATELNPIVSNPCSDIAKGKGILACTYSRWYFMMCSIFSLLLMRLGFPWLKSGCCSLDKKLDDFWLELLHGTCSVRYMFCTITT